MRPRGSEQPRLFTPPRGVLTPKTTAGFEAIAFAEDVLGVTLIPWQRWLFQHMLELNPDGTFRFRTVLVQVARQNGKSTFAQILSLWRMFIDRAGLVIGTAQNLDVAEEVWTGAVDMAEGCADLAAEIAAVDRTNGKKALRLVSGERYKVAAASRRGGRGLSGDLVLLDEIREHQTWDAWAAVTKTTMARPKPQIVALSNAGDDQSVVLNHLRELGEKSLDGTDGDFGFFEWSAEPDCDLDDQQQWELANPSLGFTITEQAIMSALGTDPEWIFRTEVLCQRVSQRSEQVVPMWQWVPLGGDATIAGDAPLALFVDVALDRSVSWVGLCARNGDGTPQVEIAASGPGTDWVADWVGGVLERRDVLAVGARSAGPVASLLPDLAEACERHERPFVKVGSGDFAAMCGAFFDAVAASTLAHRSDSRVDAALASARKHKILDAWSWERTRVDIDAAPLVAVTGALSLHARYARITDGDPLQNIW